MITSWTIAHINHPSSSKPATEAAQNRAFNMSTTTGTTIDFTPEAATEIWDDIEVQKVWEDSDGNCDVIDEDQEPEDGKTYWSVYLHQVEGGVQCIADLPTKELANKFSELLKAAVTNFQSHQLF